MVLSIATVHLNIVNKVDKDNLFHVILSPHTRLTLMRPYYTYYIVPTERGVC